VCNMDVWQPDSFPMFLLFFIPGFISLKAYDLMVPKERRDISKSIFDVIVYSCINFIIIYYPLISFIKIYNFYDNSGIYEYFCFLIIFLIIPLLWPLILLKIFSVKLISSRIIHPFSKAWDFKFNKRKPALIIVHLRDGRLIGGLYGYTSFASSYPAEEQIYLETVWKLNENGNFEKPLDKSQGIVILKDEILAVEFFDVELEDLS
jgi:hypothetical protein